MEHAKVIVFDSNETLLDLGALDDLFQDAYGDRIARERWFREVLSLSLVSNVLGVYRPFDELADTALDMIAEGYGARGGHELQPKHRDAIRAALLEIPAHADVHTALEQLRTHGLRMAVLTNSTQRTVDAQLEHAQLTRYFERVISVDQVGRYKPAAATYEHAAKTLGVAIGEMQLVAAHAWDVRGAQHAGARAAFIARPGKALDRGKDPDIVAADLQEFAAHFV